MKDLAILIGCIGTKYILHLTRNIKNSALQHEISDFCVISVIPMNLMSILERGNNKGRPTFNFLLSLTAKKKYP